MRPAVLSAVHLWAALAPAALVRGWSTSPRPVLGPRCCRTRGRLGRVARAGGPDLRGGRRGGGSGRATTRARPDGAAPDGEGRDERDDDADKDVAERRAPAPGGAGRIVEGIEGAVRSVGLGDENYRFGDLSRRAASGVKAATEEAVRAATGDEDYRFGDLTRRAASGLARTAEGTVRAATKDEEYELFDYSRSLLRRQERIVGELISDALGDYNVPLVENLTPPQRRRLVVAAIQMLALGCLCLNFVMNVFAGATVVSAWAAAASRTGASPLSSEASWGAFLSAHSALRIFTGPATMPVQCVAALCLAPRYRKCLLWLQAYFARRIGSETVRLRQRVAAVAFAWLFGNCLGIAAATAGGVWIAGAVLGVPVR